MKKRLIAIICFISLMFIGLNGVRAVESGGSTGGGGTSQGDNLKPEGRVNNTMGYRVSIVKYIPHSGDKPKNIKSKNFVAKNAASIPSGYTIYYFGENDGGVYPKTSWSNTNELLNYKKSYGSSGLNLSDKFQEAPNFSNPGNATYDYTSVVNYFRPFEKNENQEKLIKYLHDYMNFSLEDLGEECDQSLYYYMLVEPTIAITKQVSFNIGNSIRKSSVYYYGTVSEIDVVWSNLKTTFSKHLFTPRTDFKTTSGTDMQFWYDGVGLALDSNGNETPAISISNNQNILGQNGYGVLTFWIGGISENCKKCYDRTVNKSNGDLICKNTNQNNNVTYEEQYKPISCTNATREQQKDTQYGKLVYAKDNCNIYCIESAIASLPGSILNKPRLDIHGAYFAWPTIGRNSDFSLMMSSKYTCTIVNNPGKTCSNNDKEELKSKARGELNGKTQKIKLNAGNNEQINDYLEIYDSVQSEKEANGKYIFDKISFFKIPGNLNRYVNRDSDKVSNTKPNYPYFDRRMAVVSLKRETDTSKLYNLNLSDIKLGVFSESKANYTCNYSLTKACICPSNTLRAGESLDEELKKELEQGYKNGTISCAELQKSYCNKVVCTLTDGTEKDITACLKSEQDSGVDYDTAYNRCYQENCTGYCIDIQGKKIDTSTCINEQIKKGLSAKAANDYCEKEYCPTCINRDGDRVDLKECMDMGFGYNYCVAAYCPDSLCPPDECEYSCKKTNMKNCKWKITKKVNTMINFGLSCNISGKNEICNNFSLYCPGGDQDMKNPIDCLRKKLNVKDIEEALNSKAITSADVERAFNACRETVCPTTGKIVYREIDLNNPFPGKNNKGSMLGFSNSHGSRKPGSNWNSTNLVKSQILNARGKKGYELYNTEPLVTITLTPEKIKEIRKYNNNTKYSDFNLEKVGNAGETRSSYYTSKFLRNDNNVQFSDKCKNIDSVQEFDNCYNEGDDS